MASYLIANGSNAAINNVNVAGDDVPAYSIAGPFVLTGAEVETLVAGADGAKIALIKSTSTDEQRRFCSKLIRLGRNPGA